MKRKLASLLMRLARKLDEDIVYNLFPAPSLNILACMEHGTNFKQSFGYKPGEDAKCMNGLTKLLGHNPYKGLVTMMEEGLVKEGAKVATVSVEGNEAFVDGKKVYERPEHD